MFTLTIEFATVSSGVWKRVKGMDPWALARGLDCGPHYCCLLHHDFAYNVHHINDRFIKDPL